MNPLASIPSLGSGREQLRLMRADAIGLFDDLASRKRDLVRFDILFGSVVIAGTADLAREVLVTRAKDFEKSPSFRAALWPIAGQGLFTSEGDLWRRQRKLMAPVFPPTSLARFAPDMTACAERAALAWQDGEVVDVVREATRITMAIAGKTLFDADTFDEADELGRALTTTLAWASTAARSSSLVAQTRLKVKLEILADGAPPALAHRMRKIAERLLLPVLWPGARTRELRAAVAVLDGRVERMIADRRARPSGHRDLLTLLLAARDENEADHAVMSDRQVRDEILTLFTAGHETTAAALAWALILITQDRAVYDRLRAEVDALGRVPTYEDLPKLPIAARVFKESLRLYPPVYVFSRVAVVDTSLGGHRIPKGTLVLVSPYAIHRRDEVWPEPRRFDPERFLPEHEATRDRFAFLPFGAGPRTCLGIHFGLMEGPLVLATLLHHVEFEPQITSLPAAEPITTLRPKGAVPMRVYLRGPRGSAARAALAT